MCAAGRLSCRVDMRMPERTCARPRRSARFSGPSEVKGTAPKHVTCDGPSRPAQPQPVDPGPQFIDLCRREALLLFSGELVVVPEGPLVGIGRGLALAEPLE